MSVVAHITTEGEQADLNQVLTEFNEDTLRVERDTDFPSGDSRTYEVRTSEKETLLRLYEACVEHGIVLDIYSIYHE